MSKSIQQVLEFIRNTEGRIFSIRFIKRTDGTTREMTCRTGVKKYLAKDPKKPGLDFKSHDLIGVYDMQAADPEKGYRSIPIEGISEIKMHGEWEHVDHDPRWFLRSVDVRENNLRVYAYVEMGKGLDKQEWIGIIHELQIDEWALLSKAAFEPFSGQELRKSAEISGLERIPLPFDMYGRIEKL